MEHDNNETPPCVAQWVDTDGGRLHACIWHREVAHQRTPIVMLHDSLGSVELWRDFPARLALATGRAVVAYDRLGFGRSDSHGGTLGKNFIAQECHASLLPVLDRFGLERAILFGHSVGGGMAVAAAAQCAARVAAVVTESAQAFVEDRTLDGVRQARRNFSDPAQVARLAKYHGDQARSRWVLDAWIDTWLAPGYANWSLDEKLHCPLLALHGERDEFGSALHPQRIVALGAPGELLMLDDCGHVPHRQQMAIVLPAVQAFLQRHAATIDHARSTGA
ncbi:alpha/beta fold hydrolase [Herbaspirillum sp. YR522]|uniref:alpha/beta fold hydrolase n=1 Tax=Herbaspirillum sp. YR522 TaxID=1144342 RepID=UPI00026F6536|nr:alpha/beta hydrolase [Herbaspirillum sp. YR522]EJN03580.1 putative hydrolase or acyltransferase of alpha/beta superfamily [Herbaspirillum sp. YR522]